MIRFLAEFPDILSDNDVPYIETPISIAAARRANAVGSATIVVPDFIDRRSFTWNTRMRLWRRGWDGTRSLFGNTEWFLRSITHDYTDKVYSIEFDDALALLDQRLVAYTSETPYADKTLEELGLITPNETLRIDNMMRAYVRENYGSAALDPDRNNTYIRVEDDRGFAPHGEMTAAWKVLGDVLSELAKQSADKGLELFYDLIPQPDDTLLFVVRSKVLTVDRGSDSKRILTLSADLNHLTEVMEVDDFNEVGSYVYVLGYDSGPSQVVVEVSNPAVINSNRFGRVEFTESIPEDYKESVLIDIGRSALHGRRPRRNVGARVVDGTGIIYGRDYSYGDRLMIQVGEKKYNCHVHAVSTRWEAGQEDLEVRLDGYDEDAYPTFMLPINQNEAPVVDAGDDQEIDFDETANLSATATDDGLPDPPDALTYQWTKVSGPGTVTFGTATSLTTTATFSEDGEYVLRFSASDSEKVGHDEVAITVTPEPFVPPLPGDPEYYYGDINAYVMWTSAHVFRTWNLQATTPVWELVDTDITGTIYAGQYVPVDANTVGMWLMTSTAIWWCADIMAATPSWDDVLTIATVQAADATPAVGVVQFKTMFPYWSEPGFLCVATGPAASSSNNESYQHAYFWHTHDYGQSWTQIDANNILRTVSIFTHGYFHASVYAMNIERAAPGTIWCVRYTPNISAVDVNVLKSTDGGHTWSKEAQLTDTNASNNWNSLLNPFPDAGDPSYAVAGSEASAVASVLEVSTDSWATKTTMTAPTGYTGIAGVWRVNKRTFDDLHILAWWYHTSEAQWHLLETNDGGTTWDLLYDSGLNNGSIGNFPMGTLETSRHNTPNGWPPDVDQWVMILCDNFGAPSTNLVQLTLDNFSNLLDKTGNLIALGGAWPDGANDGFALPRVGPNV